MAGKIYEKITHAELIKLGRDWLIRPYQGKAVYGHYACPVVITEISTSIQEQPDIIGFSGRKSILIECKATLADFKADKSKPFRKNPLSGVGTQRWYLAPHGVIPHDLIPPMWGLLEVTAKRIIKVARKPELQERDYDNEITILLSLLRRLNITPSGHVAISKYDFYSKKNRATFFIDEDASPG